MLERRDNMNKNYREEVLELLDEERDRQQELGKPDRNTFAMWLIIISDYVGRVGKAILNFAMNQLSDVEELEDFKRTLVKLGSLVVAWIENILEIIDVMTIAPSDETVDVETKEVEVELADDLDVEVETKL